MSTTRNRTIHFFDLNAVYYDAQDRKLEHAADVGALFAKLRTLKYSRSSDSGIVSVWGEDLIATVDVPSPDFIAGRFSKVRTTNLPGLVSEQDGYRRVRLRPGEGLYEASHFVYFPATQVVAMEFNPHAPQGRLFGNYLKQLAAKHNLMIDDVKLVIKIDPNTVARLRSMGVITAIEASVSNSVSAAIRHSGGISQALKGTAAAIKQPYIAHVSFSRERPRREGPRGFTTAVKEEVIELLTESGDILTSLKVKVEPSGGGEPQLIDLKQDRFSVKLPIEVDDGTLSSHDLYAKIVHYYQDSGIS